MNTISQPYEILGCLYAGILLGIVYAIFDLVRHAFGGGRIITCICDILYVAVAFALTAVFMYVLTFGQFRPFHALSILAGIFLYIGNVHKFIMHILHIK